MTSAHSQEACGRSGIFDVDRVDAPDNSHQLTPDDRVTPIRPNTEVEVHSNILCTLDIPYGHRLAIEIYRGDFMLEKYTDTRDEQSFAQQILIQVGAADRVDALFPCDEFGDTAANGSGMNKFPMNSPKRPKSSPAHPGHTAGSGGVLAHRVSFYHAWE